ncbi:hypothetical protein J6590_006204, partial [Homalodisca vitripennis]
ECNGIQQPSITPEITYEHNSESIKQVEATLDVYKALQDGSSSDRGPGGRTAQHRTASIL